MVKIKYKRLLSQTEKYTRKLYFLEELKIEYLFFPCLYDSINISSRCLQAREVVDEIVTDEIEANTRDNEDDESKELEPQELSSFFADICTSLIDNSDTSQKEKDMFLKHPQMRDTLQ